MERSEFQGSARFFDYIYADRDYDLIAAHYNHHLGGGVLVEYGCGTGEMLRRFKQRAFGLEPCREMADIAREKGLNVTIGRMTQPTIYAEAAAAVWSTLGYSAAQDGLDATLESVREVLHVPGRVFCFDVTHLPGLVHHGLYSRWETKHDTPFGELTRIASKSLDFVSGVLTVVFDFSIDGQQWRECHRMQCFTVPEIVAALHRNGFRVEHVCEMPNSHSETVLVNSASWEFFVKAVTR